MTHVLQICSLAFLVLAITATHVRGQGAQPPDRNSALKVFLDCGSCDETYLRTEITFVNYVRDRTDADVHILVTTENTGGGGTEYTVKLIGLGRFDGVEQTLKYVAAQTNSDDMTRAGLAAVLRLGLVRYAAETPLAPRLKVTFDAAKAAPASVTDPWNFWIFRVGTSGGFEGEESGNEQEMSASISADRTTDEWKMTFSAFGEYGEEEFVLDEGEVFTSVSRNIEGNAIVTKSLNQHWSAGLVGALQSSIFSNYDLRTRIAPGVEYDFFPYSESTRRLLVVLYTIGVETADYLEETVYGRTSEQQLDHRVETTLNLRQPWGSAGASVEVAQYLSKPDKYRVTTFGNLDIRLFKGFSVEFFGEASRRRDQLSLRRGDATNEEILVRQRELATGYEYEFGFGVSYSFGSIFNNIVNPRFRNAGGF